MKRKEVWQPHAQIKAEYSSLFLLQMKHSLARATSQRVNHGGARRRPNQTHLILGAVVRAVRIHTVCTRALVYFWVGCCETLPSLYCAVKIKARWQKTNKHKCCWGCSVAESFQKNSRLSKTLPLCNNQFFLYLLSLWWLRFWGSTEKYIYFTELFFFFINSLLC